LELGAWSLELDELVEGRLGGFQNLCSERRTQWRFGVLESFLECCNFTDMDLRSKKCSQNRRKIPRKKDMLTQIKELRVEIVS